MDPDLLTQLVRAGNDGVIPAPLAGEDMAAYKFRAACAGAVVAAKWLETKMAEEKKAAEERRNDHGFDGNGLSGAAMGGGRPDDVTVTSPDAPMRTAAEIEEIFRRPQTSQPTVLGAGTRGDQWHDQDRHPDEIGVD